MPKFGQKWPKMPQNATKSNLLGLYPKFLLPSFVDNQKSPFCVDDVAQLASGRPQMLKKINFWGHHHYSKFLAASCVDNQYFSWPEYGQTRPRFFLQQKQFLDIHIKEE